MKTFEIDKEFILDAHHDACKEWKKKLESKFPELFTKRGENIKSYEEACDILDKRVYSNNTSANDKLLTIIAAANYLDNNSKSWKADFAELSQDKFIPYFERKKSGWVVNGVHCYIVHSYLPGGFYYKNKKTAEILSAKFIDLYNQWLS